MTPSPTIYEQAPTTHRTAEKLAEYHGYRNLSHLAQDMPPGAHVLDAGAGASPLGAEVARLRPDITWVNFDYSYQDPAILEEVQRDAPDNLKFVAGDVTKLREVYEPETFDAVFSFWLLPHLSLDSPVPARKAAVALYEVTKLGGRLSVGLKFHEPKARPQRPGKYTQRMAAQDFAQRTMEATKLTGLLRYTQHLANEVATPYFGTSRYTKGTGWNQEVFDPESQQYVRGLSRSGARVAGGLAVASLSHLKTKAKR